MAAERTATEADRTVTETKRTVTEANTPLSWIKQVKKFRLSGARGSPECGELKPP